jgi:hypothetical protein
MAKSKRKRVPKTVLKLPDLEQSKSAVLNSPTSASSKRSYDHAICEFIDWYCSEPRLAFNKTVVTNCWLENRNEARKNNRLPVLKAGESVEIEMEFGVLTSHQEIEQFSTALAGEQGTNDQR